MKDKGACICAGSFARKKEKHQINSGAFLITATFCRLPDDKDK